MADDAVTFINALGFEKAQFQAVALRYWLSRGP